MKQTELVNVRYPANFTFRQDAANHVSLAQVGCSNFQLVLLVHFDFIELVELVLSWASYHRSGDSGITIEFTAVSL